MRPSRFLMTVVLLVVALLALTAASSSQTVTFSTLVNFNGTDGRSPGSFVQATNGYLYGVTATGGSSLGQGPGTVFKMSPAGVLTTLYSFCTQLSCLDGDLPVGLLQATDGNLYGITASGGANGTGGTFFKMTLAGKLITLYSFCSQANCADGENPTALVQGNDGNFYGTTLFKGANNDGTVFRITAAGKLTTLHTFVRSEGAYPIGLIQANNGNFYGVTYSGGANDWGTIYKITPTGTLTTLYNFCSQTGCPDGNTPFAALVQANDGNLYGTTAYGASASCLDGCGTVFRVSLTGALTTLHSFCLQANCPDGSNPSAPLVQATNGNFYGTTLYGDINSNCGNAGSAGCGTVFEIDPAGNLSTLHDFCTEVGCTDGAYGYALVQATNGNFYGTSDAGGTDNDGTLFGLVAGLGPFIKTLPTSGKVGANVIILGNKLTGTTAVDFNGMAATFTVVSSSEITAVVPSGATTGKVVVTTPGGGALYHRVRPCPTMSLQSSDDVWRWSGPLFCCGENCGEPQHGVVYNYTILASQRRI
jgi:uncharacterized repeat protein (TIGR03803 family)